jgi:lysophospholipase L1-like esterase
LDAIETVRLAGQIVSSRMRIAPALLGLFLVVGCSGSDGASTDAPADAGGGTDAGTTSNGDSGAAPAPDAGLPGIPVGTSYAFGTYIALGDSISDRGGEAPFFYDLLLKNDDATYPAFKGKDLTTRYPGITYVHGAVAGAQTTVYHDETAGAFSTLVDQVKALKNSYPGDVLITITIGGNDLNSHALDAIQGKDQQDKTELAAALKSTLGELTTAGRLGSGKVLIVEGNVYDASDGTGNWGSVGRCGPKIDTGKAADTAAFTAWNDVIAQAIADVGDRDRALDLHGLFFGHGFTTTTDRWFAADCLHPVKKGHNVIRSEVWRILTGETVQ